MAISHDGIGQVCVTLYCDDSITQGVPCCLSADNHVTACAYEDEFCGIVVNAKNSLANVIIQGIVTVPYSGETPNIGFDYLAGDGQGKVTVVSDAPKYTIFSVDTVNKTVTFLL